MRPRWVLLPLFSVLVSTAAGAGIKRADDESSSAAAKTTSSDKSTSSSSSSAAPTTSSEDSKTTSSSKTSSSQDSTTTVTKTVTGDVVTVTKTTGVKVTKTKEVTSTKIKVETDTTTVSGEVQTQVVIVTTTVAGNAKRGVPDVPAVTSAPSTDDDQAFDLLRLFKRDVKTETVETTVAGSTTTITVTNTEEVESTKVTTTEVVSKMTVTENPDASSTTTITSTQTETSLAVTTNIVTRTATASSAPSATSSAGSGNSDSGSSGSNSGSDGGLSTGAKAGIGAGVGVAGLALIIGLAWFCIRRRRDAADHDHDDLFPASEVPVGAGGARASTHTATMSHASISHQPSMSQSTAGGVAYPTPSRSPTFPNVAPEGYRGTAMGDGRAGYAKPEPYGAGYAKPEPYGSAYTRTSTGPSSMGSVQDAYAPPNRTSTYDSARAAHDIDAANIGVASTSPVPHQYGTSGSRFSEMETTEQPYRPPYMDNVR